MERSATFHSILKNELKKLIMQLIIPSKPLFLLTNRPVDCLLLETFSLSYRFVVCDHLSKDKNSVIPSNISFCYFPCIVSIVYNNKNNIGRIEVP